jgi:ATP-dependent DNA ligase
MQSELLPLLIFMKLPIPLSLEPMEAETAAALPRDGEWLYEPKWDGFRCLAFRDGAQVELQSKSGKPLVRYFPELESALKKLSARRFVLDGEIVVEEGAELSFDALLQRVHPAASRIARLSAETPATLIVFDILVDSRGRKLSDLPLAERRKRLEEFAAKHLEGSKRLALCPATPSAEQAEVWLRGQAGTDGVIAKRADAPYMAGTREGMVKVKRRRSADCVVGGFRDSVRGGVGSLLLGLFDEEGTLHHVGFTSSMPAAMRSEVAAKLARIPASGSFTGRAPGGPSRWSRGEEREWHAVKPSLVVEVEYDHFTNGRFRHGTKFVRWRPDKRARQCTLDQLER